MIETHWNDIVNERTDRQEQEGTEDDEEYEAWEAETWENTSEEWGEPEANQHSSSSAGARGLTSSLADKFYAAAEYSEGFAKVAEKPKAVAGATGNRSYGSSEKDYGCPLVRRFYDEESIVDRCRRVGSRVASSSKRLLCLTAPILFALMLCLVVLSSIQLVSIVNDDVQVLGLARASKRVYRTTQNQSDALEKFLVSRLPVGYHKRTFVYLNGVRTPCT